MCNDHNKHQHKLRHGSALEHGEAHKRDHNRWSRRSFLKSMGIAGGAGMMLGNLSITSSMANLLSFMLNSGIEDRILVLIRLNGGNDGLNTTIPLYQYDTYMNLRPTIGIAQNQITNLNDDFGIPEELLPLYPFWQEGKMKIINSVGYPDQNLSHFRSSDIWGSSSDSNEVINSGWLGRFIMNKYPDYLTNPPEIPPAIQIGNVGDIVFNDETGLDLAVSVTDPEQLGQIAQNGELYSLSDLPDCYFGDQLGFIRAVTNTTFIYADAIKTAYDNGGDPDADYTTDLGEKLAMVARLIKGNLGTKLYMVDIVGFDTHAEQNNLHPYLLSSLASAIKNFYDDLASENRDKEVLTLTFSEFGRRIEENASWGTDHGAAAPMLVFGEGLNGNGFLGANPDLQNVDDIGNLIFDIDFRQVYASVLENWLCIEPETVDGILGDYFERLDLGLDCVVSSTSPYTLKTRFKHEARYLTTGQIAIHYQLPQAANVEVQIFDILGQPVETLFRGYQLPGEYQQMFSPGMRRLANGYYVYHINVGGESFSNPVRVVE